MAVEIKLGTAITANAPATLILGAPKHGKTSRVLQLTREIASPNPPLFVCFTNYDVLVGREVLIAAPNTLRETFAVLRDATNLQISAIVLDGLAEFRNMAYNEAYAQMPDDKKNSQKAYGSAGEQVSLLLNLTRRLGVPVFATVEVTQTGDSGDYDLAVNPDFRNRVMPHFSKVQYVYVLPTKEGVPEYRVQNNLYKALALRTAGGEVLPPLDN